MKKLTKYRLIGYNSGGYRTEREIIFEGTIEKCYRLDPKDPYSLRQIPFFKVTHADGKVTQEENEFLQRLLDEQSYIESFLTVELEEIPLSNEDISKAEERRREKIKKKLVSLFYKTRYGLILPLLYLAGEWLEGPPERVILLSKTFCMTALLLLMYVVLYFRKLNPGRYPLVSWLFNGLFVFACLYMVLQYPQETDENYEGVRVLLLGMFAIHLSFWFGSLFDKKV
jgi:hypothetical protein